ncbi:MAG: glycosyltransferase [Candidatus Harrisonbacteria bacterium]|nr:glycosyltransferase [Candidatus Harrisonbacteria bacterium]MBI2604150.1 glycosyltransferase [Candidatus Harrisonbacteria bacterium]
MSKPFISVIIPTFNNARTLPLALIDADHHLSRMEVPTEIIIVDDHSTDATAEIARRFRMLLGNIRLMVAPQSRGIGAGVREGMLAAEGRWRVVIPPTNAVSVVEFHKAFPYLERGADIAIGSRALMRSRVRPALRIHERLFRIVHNFLMQAILVPGVRDTESGWCCVSARAAEQIFKATRVDSAGWTGEMLALARTLGYHEHEFPVFFANERRGFSYAHYIESFLDALRVRWMLSRKTYQL